MTGIVILAAGASTRMGQPKQQLSFQNQTLLQHSVEVAIASLASKVIVVLGANETAIRPDIRSKDVVITVNNIWEEGMASSIRSGLYKLIELHPTIENMLIMLCDQPFVNTDIINDLIKSQDENHAGIVACLYQDTIGAPVIFNRYYFDDLLALRGQEGAKKLLVKYGNQVTTIPFHQGSIDIDTPEDYQRLINAQR